MRMMLSAVLAMAVAGGCLGQGKAPAVKAAAGSDSPLIIQDGDPEVQKGVRLSALDTVVRVDGLVAEVSTTLVFTNTLNRQLEGELEFPLPDGGVLSGYALDVPAGSGILEEGVPVEKEQARRILEAEERVKADPGLIEQTVGNNFKTRIYPIPANGTRTVRVTWVTGVKADAKEAVCTIVNPAMGKPDHAGLRVEVAGAADGAVTVEGVEGLTMKADKGMAAGEVTAMNGGLPEKIVIHEAVSGELVRAERFVPPATVDENGNVVAAGAEGYFVVAVMPPAGMGNGIYKAASRIGVVWDTSLSRARGDHAEELGLLAEVLKGRDVSVQLQTTDGAPARDFAVKDGDVSELVAAIRGLTYDGALQMDNVVETPRGNGDPGNVRGVEQVLFFSEGLVTLGKPVLGGAEAGVPVMAISSSAQADHGVLRRLAEGSGGAYVDLQQEKPEAAAAEINGPVMSARLTGEGISEVYPKAARVVPGQRVVFTGKMAAAGKATMAWPGGAAQELTLPAAADGAGQIARYWAGQKVAELSGDVVGNGEALAAVAKKFNVVTPNTSLLVLETVDQYVKYHVVPPQSRNDVYAEFVKRAGAEGVAVKKEEGDKIERVLGLWKAREAWYDQTFTYPADFKYTAPKEERPLPAVRAQFGVDGAATRPEGVVAGLPATEMDNLAHQVNANSADQRQLRSIQPPQMNLQQQWGATGGLPAPMASDTALFSADAGRPAGPTETISIKAWDPDMPYLRSMKRAEDPYAAYLKLRGEYFEVPSFYLDAGNALLAAGKREQGIRVLTNIAQLKLEDAGLLRIAAYRLMQVGAYDVSIALFEKAKALRPDEPQSFRDLAQALAWRGLERRAGENPIPGYDDLNRSLGLYKNVVMNNWDRFPEIETVALMEANAVWDREKVAESVTEHSAPLVRNPLDARLVRDLDCDLRIALTWDADDTDIDLHVVEPSGEEAMYSHNRTTIGGLVSKDFTQGYGPEEYCLHHAMKGVYTINAVYYGTRTQKMTAPVTVQATVFTNFGRKDEKRETLTLRLVEQKETVEVGKVTVK